MTFHRSICIKNYLRPSFIHFKRQYVSALFATGDKGIDFCQVVSPHIDLGERIKDFQELENNVSMRKCKINLEKLQSTWAFFSTVNEIKDSLDERRMQVSKTINELSSLATTESQEEINKLIIHSKIMRDDMKTLKTALWPIQEEIMLLALALPNKIHPRTPNNGSVIIDTYLDKIKTGHHESHTDLGVKLNLLKYTSPYNYYLKNDAAILELSAKFFFSESLRNMGFVQFSNPDFAKSVIVEGCGLNHTDPDEIFILHHNENTKVNEHNRLHLVGGGSLMSFAAYHTRNMHHTNAFPMKYFSIGRQYKPVPSESKLGLFEVSQASVVEIFIATKDCESELNNELDSVISNITDIYKKIGYHFKVSYVPADEIDSWESLRVNFEMFSPYLNKYISVGHISVSDDYISKRLQFTYKEKKEDYFPKIISGTVLNVPKLLGCLLEQDQTSPFEIPTALQNVF